MVCQADLCCCPTSRKRDRRVVPCLIGILVVALVVSAGSKVDAQTRAFKKTAAYAHPSLTLVCKTVDYAYIGTNVPALDLHFDRPAFGISYTFRELGADSRLQVVYGRQPRDLTDSNSRALSLLDIDLTAIGNLVLAEGEGFRFSLAFPIFFSYRRLGITDSPVNKSGLTTWRTGIGTGLDLNLRLSENLMTQSRVIIMANEVTTSQQTDTRWHAGVWRSILEAETMFHIEDVLGAGYGISLGGGFRVQRIAAVAGAFFPETDDIWSTFKSTESSVRLGVNW